MSGLSIRDVSDWWDRRPCNIRHSPAEVGTRRYFDEVEARKYRVEPHIPSFAQFPRWHGKRVLEIGCGIGTDTMNFARAGAHVTAVDVSKNSVELAVARAALFELPVLFHVGDAEHLTRLIDPTRRYDLIYSFGVIHHSPDPGQILWEARGVLAAGGELRLMVYNRRSTKAAALVARHPIRTLRHGADRVIAQQSEAQSGCPITWSYTRAGVRELVENAGFTVDEITVDHIFPWKISDYVQYRYTRRWYWRLVPRPLFRWLERHVGWHLLVIAH